MVIEGDAWVVINLLSINSSSLSPFGYIFDYIKRMVNSFRLFNWSFTRKNDNNVTYSLVKYALNISDFKT